MNPLLLDKCPQTGRYLLRLNASLLRHGDCSRFLLYKALYGLSRPQDWWKADYGSAVHRALQYWYGERVSSGKPLQQLVVEARKAGMDYYKDVFVPEDDWRTTSHLSMTLNAYFKHYETDELSAEVDDGGKPRLEQTFELEFYSDEFCIVYLVGTVDMRGVWQGQPVLVDTKTTGFWQNTNNPDKWLETFELSGQLMLYKWADKTKPYQCLVNGVLLKKTGVEFQRRLFEFREDMLAGYIFRVQALVKTLVRDLKSFSPENVAGGFGFQRNFDHCDGKFGMCEFKSLCLANNAEHEEQLIAQGFERKMYDPRKLQEEV